MWTEFRPSGAFSEIRKQKTLEIGTASFIRKWTQYLSVVDEVTVAEFGPLRVGEFEGFHDTLVGPDSLVHRVKFSPIPLKFCMETKKQSTPRILNTGKLSVGETVVKTCFSEIHASALNQDSQFDKRLCTNSCKMGFVALRTTVEPVTVRFFKAHEMRARIVK